MNIDYQSAAELLDLCKARKLTIWQAALEREHVQTGQPEQVLIERMLAYYLAMKESIRAGLENTETSPSGLSGGDAARLLAYSKSECPLFGTTCTPETPAGAPMVSSEGACAAYFHHALAGGTSHA